MAPGRSLAERRAARCGFTEAPPRVNTSKVAAPILTIPPGISPTALLVSPVVMLSDSQALLSPTTGTIKLPPSGPEIMGPNQVTTDTDRDPYEYIDSSFMFKPQTDIVPNPCMQISEDQVVFHSNNEFHDEVRCPDQDLKVYTGELLTNVEGPDYTTVDEKSVVDTTFNLDEPLNEEDVVPTHLEGDQTGEFSTTGIGRSSDDGYNWRKYGQKQVKGSEYPRSYYKCTNPSCQVKKKVERSLDGQITEIIYKGSHNHVKPQPTRRSAFGSPYSTNEISDSAAGPGSSANTEDGSTWISSQPEPKDNNSVDWRIDVLEGTSSASVVTELSDPLSIVHGKHTNMMSDNPEHSSTLNEDEDGTIQGSMSAVDDGDDENESKRRKKENCMIETNPASRAVCESRVVVQTVSDVDILDDGYRWRKYGQKIVKGNPNPRSYYKCTSPGCSVRKHVERASNDLKSVITTYEGKHNHEVPVARNSNHMSSGCNQQSSCSVPASMVLPGSIRSYKGELHGPDFVPRFDRKLELGNHHLKSSYVGCFTSDSKIGVSPCYEMKMAHLQPMPYASLGLNTVNVEARQVSPITNIMQDLPFPFPMGLQRPNLAISGYATNYARPMNPEFQSFLGGQNKDNLRRFIRLPKQEQENPSYNPRTDTLSNGSLYDQLPGRHP